MTETIPSTTTAEPADPDTSETAPEFYGHIIIEWPAPRKASYPVPLAGGGCSIYDADTSRQIVTAEQITVSADAAHWITAQLTVCTDDKGLPVLFQNEDGSVTIYPDEDGNGVRTATFPFLVTEMRVRQET